MPRIKPPVVITANRLTTGEVVFWGNERQWVRKISDAVPFYCADVAAETAAEESSGILAPERSSLLRTDINPPLF